ncbi:MAG TPA: ABC transporter ATP-binding protein [Desulfobacteraceae bacterium]|nr:ABC transporter ATP-binding protein [Desulfobacteraceae bacterium]
MSHLKVNGLSKRFGGVQALSDVNFTVEEGEILGLIGPNGAGKTTLFNMVAGSLPVDSGDVFFMGEPITGLPPHEVCRRGIARTFQITRIFAEMTVMENVLVAQIGNRQKLPQGHLETHAFKLLELTGLAGKEYMQAGQLNLIDKKRVELARALATGPRLILLDEVLGGLNTSEIPEGVDLIRTIRDKFQVTVFWIEHIMGAIMRLSERVLVLDQGRLISEGSPEKVSRDPLVVEAYLGEQNA